MSFDEIVAELPKLGFAPGKCQRQNQNHEINFGLRSRSVRGRMSSAVDGGIGRILVEMIDKAAFAMGQLDASLKTGRVTASLVWHRIQHRMVCG